jgi:beta-N-acetylhexosaminidase
VQSAEAALHAGCDMVLVCNQPASADELLAGLKPSAARGGAQRRIKQMKARGRSPRWSKLPRQPEYLSALTQIRQVLG